MKKKMFRKVSLIILLMSVSWVRMQAEDIRVSAKVDSNHMTIGDWLKVSLEVQHAPNVVVTFPTIPDSLDGLEVIRRDSPSMKKTDQAVLESMTLILTTFDSGMHVVPPIDIAYTLAGDSTKRIAQTSPIVITVRGVSVDTTQEIKDVKPPLSVPITFAEILPYLIGLCVLGGAVWLLFYIMRKRKRGESLLPEAPPRPAHEVALEGLRSLEAEQLWQRGKIKEYHSQVTEIIRIYIERRFKVLAMEMTSEEVLESLVIRALSDELVKRLREMLMRADVVKFAKFQPLPDENSSSLALAFTFVESTWQGENVNVEAPPQEVAA